MAQSMNKLLFYNTVFRNGSAKHTSLGGLWYSLFIFWRSQLLQYFEQLQLMVVSLPLLGTTENDNKTSSFCNLFIIWASFESMWKGHLFSGWGGGGFSYRALYILLLWTFLKIQRHVWFIYLECFLSKICKYYLQGACSYGNSCRFDHVKPSSGRYSRHLFFDPLLVIINSQKVDYLSFMQQVLVYSHSRCGITKPAVDL